MTNGTSTRSDGKSAAQKLEQAAQVSHLVVTSIAEAQFLKADKIQIRKERQGLKLVLNAGAEEIKTTELKSEWFGLIVQWLAERFVFSRAGSDSIPAFPLVSHESFSFQASLWTGSETLALRVKKNVQLNGREVLSLSDFQPRSRAVALGEIGLSSPAIDSVLNQPNGLLAVGAPDPANLQRAVSAVLSVSNARHAPGVPFYELRTSALQASSAALILVDLLTTDALDGAYRLKEAGYDPANEAFRGMLTFAFVRRTCDACSRQAAIDQAKNGLLPEPLRFGPSDPYLVGHGCENCGHTGFRGVLGLQSILIVDEQLRSAFPGDRSAFYRLAYSKGTRSLLEDGLLKVKQGKTALEPLLQSVRGVPEQYVPLLKAGGGSVPHEQEQSKSLLVVEDDADQRGILEMVFRSAGYSVQLAESGSRALEMLRAKRPDLIVTDLMMPNMDGKELVTRLKKDPQLSSIPVLVLTVVSDAEQEYNLLEIGADDYCEKTIQRKILLKRIENLLKRTSRQQT